jgi:sugar/nucleoside kinase (ribokinase family)
VSTKSCEVSTDISACTLQTPTGGVVNPTGAGNAYSAAVTACLGKGLSLLDAACVGAAVGAALCEHQNLPPWSWETIHRIHDGADEVKRKL